MGSVNWHDIIKCFPSHLHHVLNHVQSVGARCISYDFLLDSSQGLAGEAGPHWNLSGPHWNLSFRFRTGIFPLHIWSEGHDSFITNVLMPSLPCTAMPRDRRIAQFFSPLGHRQASWNLKIAPVPYVIILNVCLCFDNALQGRRWGHKCPRQEPSCMVKLIQIMNQRPHITRVKYRWFIIR